MTQERLAGWEPIETAPKDGTYVIIWSGWFGGAATIAHWDDDRHANKKAPRWISRDRVYGRKSFVDIPPTHWMPLPPPPPAVVGEGGNG